MKTKKQLQLLHYRSSDPASAQTDSAAVSGAEKCAHPVTELRDTRGVTVDMSLASSTTDSELLHRYEKEGNEAAFRELVERYQSMVLGTAFRRSGNAEIAREVAQEVFAALARKANFLIGRPSIGGWLHQAALYQAARALQSEVRRHVRDERYSQELPTVAPSAVPDAGRPEQLAIVDEALDVLSAADREALVLHYFQDLSYPEMAKLLGVNEPAVRQRVSRALERLGKHLRNRGVKGNVVLLLLSAVAIQSTIAAPAGLASAALATAAAGGGYSAYLVLTALLSHGAAKTAAILLALAGLGALWHEVESHTPEPHDSQVAVSVSEPPNPNSLYAALSDPQASATASSAVSGISPVADSEGRTSAQTNRTTSAAITANSIQRIGNLGGQVKQGTASAGPPGTVKPAVAASLAGASVPQAPPVTRSPVKPSKPIDTGSSDGNTGSAEGSDNSPGPSSPGDPGFQFPGVLGEIAELGGLGAVIDELRRVELVPRKAAALYGELLEDVLALDPLQRIRVETVLEDHYEMLKSKGIAGVRPPDIDLGEWKLLRETSVSEAVEGVKEVLADVTPDTKIITDVLALGEKQDSDGDHSSGSILEPITDVVDSTVVSALPKLTAPLKLP